MSHGLTITITKTFWLWIKLMCLYQLFTMCNLSNSCKTIEKRCAFFSFEQAMTDKIRNRSQFLEHLACRFKWNVSYYHWIFQHSECCNTLSCGCLTPLNTRYILQGETTCIYIFHRSVVFGWSVGLWLVFFLLICGKVLYLLFMEFRKYSDDLLSLWMRTVSVQKGHGKT